MEKPCDEDGCKGMDSIWTRLHLLGSLEVDRLMDRFLRFFRIQKRNLIAGKKVIS